MSDRRVTPARTAVQGVHHSKGTLTPSTLKQAAFNLGGGVAQGSVAQNAHAHRT